MKAHWQAEKEAIGAIRDLKEELEAHAQPSSSARPTSRRRPRSATAASPSSSGRSTRPPRTSTSCRPSQQMLKEEVDEEDIAEVVSKWTGVPVSAGSWRARCRSSSASRSVLHERVIGQDDAVTRGGQRHPPQPGRPVRPEPADRLVPVPRPHRRRQDRAGPGAGRLPLRRRAGHGPHRHERVHGEALGVPPHRRASRLRRLRRGRPAHRGRAPPALRGGAARRDREGPPRRVQRAAAGARRRPPHRRPGPHGRLHQRRAHHDVEPAGRSADVLQARVHQPDRRHRPLPGAHRGRPRRTSSSIQLASAARAAGRPPHRARRHRRGRGAAGPRGLRPGLRRPAAQAGHPARDRRPRWPWLILEGKVGEGDTVVVDAADGTFDVHAREGSAALA